MRSTKSMRGEWSRIQKPQVQTDQGDASRKYRLTRLIGNQKNQAKYRTKFEYVKQIGDGTFGDVYLALPLHNTPHGHRHTKNPPPRRQYAVKKMKSVYLSWKDALKEMEIVVAAEVKRHPNIIHMIEAFREAQQLYMVFEYMECNLYQLMKERSMKRFNDGEIRSISGQILCGLQYLHEKGFFHRDLKPENILCNGTQVIKLADFGQARFIRSRPPYTEYVSTRWYRAPELVLSAKFYSIGVDIWAVGCIMAEIVMLRPLFDGATAADQLFKIVRVLGTPKKEEWSQGFELAEKINMAFPQGYLRQNLGQIIKPCSLQCVDVIAGTLQYNPQKRPSAKTCLQMEFFSKQITSNGRSWEPAERVNKISTGVDRKNIPPLRARLTEPNLSKLMAPEQKNHTVRDVSPVEVKHDHGALGPKMDSDLSVLSSTATLPVITTQRNSLPDQFPVPVTHPIIKLPLSKVRQNSRPSGDSPLLQTKLNLAGQKRFPLEINATNRNGTQKVKDEKGTLKLGKQNSSATVSAKPPLNLRLPTKNGPDAIKMPPPLLLNLSRKRSSSPQFSIPVIPIITEDEPDLFSESKPPVMKPPLHHQLSSVESLGWLKPRDEPNSTNVKPTFNVKPLGFSAQNSSLSLSRPLLNKTLSDKKSREPSWWEK